MMDFSALRPIKDTTTFEKAVKNLINSNFAEPDKFEVYEERKLYNPQVSEYIWKQNKGLKPHVVEVYFDGEYVCDITSNTPPPEAVELISKNLINAINRKKRWTETD